MPNSNAAPAANPRVKGFQKGADPRRNVHGQVSKKTLSFNKTLRDLIVAEGERKHTGAVADA